MYTQQEIASCILESSRSMADQLNLLSDPDFFMQPAEGKWSPAEHLHHLILSVKPLNKALSAPRFLLRFFGQARRDGMQYEQLVKKYQEKLAAGGTATRRYVPRTRKITEKEVLLSSYRLHSEKLVSKVVQLKEHELDMYVLPHPLLGKITLREMLFFTIYHTYHHMKLARKQQPRRGLFPLGMRTENVPLLQEVG
jgi:hypothetical protein